MKAQKEMMPSCGEIWRHYKGGLYLVLSRAQHTEREDEELVIYCNLDGSQTWARPLSVWQETVTLDNEEFQRFTPVNHDAALYAWHKAQEDKLLKAAGSDISWSRWLSDSPKADSAEPATAPALTWFADEDRWVAASCQHVDDSPLMWRARIITTRRGWMYSLIDSDAELITNDEHLIFAHFAALTAWCQAREQEALDSARAEDLAQRAVTGDCSL